MTKPRFTLRARWMHQEQDENAPGDDAADEATALAAIDASIPLVRGGATVRSLCGRGDRWACAAIQSLRHLRLRYARPAMFAFLWGGGASVSAACEARCWAFVWGKRTQEEADWAGRSRPQSLGNLRLGQLVRGAARHALRRQASNLCIIAPWTTGLASAYPSPLRRPRTHTKRAPDTLDEAVRSAFDRGLLSFAFHKTFNTQ